MSTEHPITPPPELICKWRDQWIDGAAEDEGQGLDSGPSFAVHIATQAARWGADQELEASCEWLREAKHHGLGYEVGAMLANRLRATRRPKPLSLAEEALEQLRGMEQAGALDCNIDAIHRALERLQELENNG